MCVQAGVHAAVTLALLGTDAPHKPSIIQARVPSAVHGIAMDSASSIASISSFAHSWHLQVVASRIHRLD